MAASEVLHTKLVGAIAVLAVFAALSGCNSSSQGSATPATTESRSTSNSTPTSSSANAELPTDGAPKVNNPLDTSGFQRQPCLALTSDQAKNLNVTSPGQQRQGPLGLICDWETPQDSGLIDLQWTDKDPRGLSAVYEADKAGKWGLFRELAPIGGFPAVVASTKDDRAQGDCTVVVGVSDKYSFNLALTQSRSKVGTVDPCDVAVQVAGMVLTTMKAGG